MMMAAQGLLHILRDERTDTAAFRHASDNIARLLAAQALSTLPHRQETVQTPVGSAVGRRLAQTPLLVPIYRAGQALVGPMLELLPDARVGSLLIQRDEETSEPRLFYSKLPAETSERALILDPMLATAGSARMAVEILQRAGYEPSAIHFVGVVASRRGFERMAELIGEANITVAAIDQELDERNYIVPGLGDYGDRYFGT